MPTLSYSRSAGGIQRTVSWLCVTVTTIALVSPLALAQGGPPFRSDDPDTPGNRHWEINMGFVGERNPIAGAYAVPNLDINYGLGHRIQLKYEVPLSIQEMRGDSGHVAAGLGNSLLGLKYRFYAHHPKTEIRDKAGERESTFGLSVHNCCFLWKPARGSVQSASAGKWATGSRPRMSRIHGYVASSLVMSSERIWSSISNSMIKRTSRGLAGNRRPVNQPLASAAGCRSPEAARSG
jgi:hypothetical protein